MLDRSRLSGRIWQDLLSTVRAGALPSRRPSGRPLPRLGEYGDQGVKQFKLTEQLKKLIWGTEHQSGCKADQDIKPNEFGEVKKSLLDAEGKRTTQARTGQTKAVDAEAVALKDLRFQGSTVTVGPRLGSVQGGLEQEFRK